MADVTKVKTPKDFAGMLTSLCLFLLFQAAYMASHQPTSLWGVSLLYASRPSFARVLNSREHHRLLPRHLLHP